MREQIKCGGGTAGPVVVAGLSGRAGAAAPPKPSLPGPTLRGAILKVPGAYLSAAYEASMRPRSAVAVSLLRPAG